MSDNVIERPWPELRTRLYQAFLSPSLGENHVNKLICLCSSCTSILFRADLRTPHDWYACLYVCRSPDDFAAEHPDLVFVCDEVESVDATRSQAKFASGRVFHFSRWAHSTPLETPLPLIPDAIDFQTAKCCTMRSICDRSHPSPHHPVPLDPRVALLLTSVDAVWRRGRHLCLHIPTPAYLVFGTPRYELSQSLLFNNPRCAAHL